MNRLLAVSSLLLLVVVAAFALVATNAYEIKPEGATSDEQEVAQLDDKSAIFNDFCLATRDYVKGDLRSKSLSLVPTTIMDLLSDTANRHKNIKARLDQIVKDPSAELKRLDNFVAEQQKSLGQRMQTHPFEASKIYNRARNAGEQAREQVRGFINNPAPYLQKVDGFVAQQQRSLGQLIQNTPIQPAAFFKNAYEGIQSMANRIRAAPATLALDTCKAVEKYEQEILKRFEEAKKELASKDASVVEMKLSDVPCATISRIQTIRKTCEELKELENSKSE